jgi:hypothetical protein
MAREVPRKGQAVAYAPAEVKPGGAAAVRAFVDGVHGDALRAPGGDILDLIVDGELIAGVPRCEDADLWPQPGTWLP